MAKCNLNIADLLSQVRTRNAVERKDRDFFNDYSTLMNDYLGCKGKLKRLEKMPKGRMSTVLEDSDDDDL